MSQKIKASRATNLDQSEIIYTSGAKQAFIKLRQVFIKASKLNYFYLEHYIYIKIDISNYIIGRIFSQLILNNLS